MTKLFIFSGWFVLCGLLLSSSTSYLGQGGTILLAKANANTQQSSSSPSNLPDNNTCPDILAIATTQARNAYNLSLNAQTAADWDQVTLGWLQAITGLQSLPLTHPQKTFAQKKILEYMDNLTVAMSRNISAPLPFSSFNNALLDEQLRLYLSYVAVVGVPDVLIVGSSRSLQAINPKELRFALAAQGLDGLRVFNFSINGATAQVVNLQLTQLLSPQQLPKMIIWADGVRGFNSGNSDRTYQNILNSTGYQRAVGGDRPALLPAPNCPLEINKSLAEKELLSQILARPALGQLGLIPLNIDAYGFNYVEGSFNPATYFLQIPRVAGQFDAEYRGFNLGGEQGIALNNVINFTKQQGINLVFVSLPLTATYLDPVRRNYEQQFRVFMQQQANQNGFIFIDFSLAFLARNDLFVDPSHVNFQGAAIISRQLAGDRRIPWSSLK